MSGDEIGFGVIGLGQIYQLAHSLAFREGGGGRAVAVCDLDESLVAEEARVLGAAGYTDYRALLEDDAVEAVDIVLPHNLHYTIAHEALEAGKHVLVEKPMTVDAADSLELIELAHSKGLTFTVNENTRFIAAYLEAAELLGDGVIGEPTLVRTLISGSELERLSNPQLWKGRLDGSCGGAIIDAGAHSFYLLKWMFGEIDSLQGRQERLAAGSQVEDWAIVTGCLASGGMFSTEFTFMSGGPWNERLEIHGTQGLIVVDQQCDPPAVLYRGRRDYGGSAIPGVPYEPRTWKYRSIAAGILDFSTAVRDGHPPAVDPRDGHYAVRVIESAYRSTRTGKPQQV